MKTIDTFDRFKLVNPQTFKAGVGKASDIELVTTRKEKPKFDINQEIANRTFIRPLPPKGHIVKNSIVSAPLNFVQDVKTDFIALKSATGGQANDHQLGKLNDLGMKLGGLAIAAYLFTMKPAPVTRAMEFVGFGSFFASMALWPKIALDIPARLIHGFSPFMRYEDNQGRKKGFFSDNQFIPFDMLSDKEIERIGNRLKIPTNLANRRDAIEEKMRQIALQNNTMWMLTAGFATPVLSSLICNALEPHVENLHSIYLNRKADRILEDFKNLKENYKTNEIVTQVEDIIKLNHNKPVTDKLIDELSHALTVELDSNVRRGVKADLEQLFRGNRDGDFVDTTYRVSKSQVKKMVSVISQSLKEASEGVLLSDVLSAVTPTEQQISDLLTTKGYFGKALDDIDIGLLMSDVSRLVKNNLDVQKAAGKNIEPNIYVKFGNAITNGGRTESLYSVITSVPSKIFDTDTQRVIREFAVDMQNFCAENNALHDYSYKKLAFAPNTSKAKYWNDFVNSLVKTLKITPKEIEETRYDRKLVGELFNRKMWEFATSDSSQYRKFISTLAGNIKKSGKHVKPEFASTYFEQVKESFNLAATNFREKGFEYTAERIAGNGKTERGSLLSARKSFVNNNLLNIRSTLAAVINKANVFRTIYEHPDFNFLGASSLPKEIKEEMVALIEYLTTEGRISDYSVKFDFRRNLEPNLTDKTNIKFENGHIVYEFYNPKAIEKNGGCKKMDKNFFKQVMKALFEVPLSESTKSAIVDQDVLKMLTEYRSGMYNDVGRIENFMYPDTITGDMKYEPWGAVSEASYSSATPKEKANQVGAALDEMLANTLRQKYNTRKWLKTFGGFGAGLLGFTVLSQLFFGRDNNNYKKGRKA